ncbi:MAG TPA: metalloregulator ArsR/SmtB family transcription factor [Ktedonobacterales bacterium]|nr:metalloregulator ArsR/SmtB family transcription factor [Ktedonobacterales bacterium]
MPEEHLQTLLQFFKALADENRLKLLGILANRECSVEELAERLGLRAPTVSHHLTKLKELGLVGMRAEGNTHLYRLHAEELQRLTKSLLTPESVVTLVELEDGDAWERKVLRDFFDGERLKEIPASRKKREVILKWFASLFERERTYTEAEVNEIIKRHHHDWAYWRRELVGARLLQREAGVYWRL